MLEASELETKGQVKLAQEMLGLIRLCGLAPRFGDAGSWPAVQNRVPQIIRAEGAIATPISISTKDTIFRITGRTIKHEERRKAIHRWGR